MIVALAIRSLGRAPRRLLLGAMGIALPVAVFSATSFFVDSAVRSMTNRALIPVKIDMQAVATSPTVDTTAAAVTLAKIPGVTLAERFAAADMEATVGRNAPVKIRLFAIDPTYIANHSWVTVTGGTLAKGALLSDAFATLPGNSGAVSVRVGLAGQPALEPITVGGSIDLRAAAPFWAVPAGDEQGEQLFNPNAVVVDYATFQRIVLPALQKDFAAGGATAVKPTGLRALLPLSIETQVTVDRKIFVADPSISAKRATALRRTLERALPTQIRVVDNLAEALAGARADATNAKILFILLGLPGVLVAAAVALAASSALASAQRREHALLRLRGSTPKQLIRLATATALTVATLGSVVGIGLGALGVRVLVGAGAFNGTSTGRLLVTVLLSVITAAIITAVRLVPMVRASKRPQVVVDRRQLETGWSPNWMKNRLDIVAIVTGVVIFGIVALLGGFKNTAGAEGQTLALGFFLLLGPLAIWLGATMLALRLLNGLFRRVVRPDRAAPLKSWPVATLRFIGRRPARLGVAALTGALAVSFGANLASFTHTYDIAKKEDVAMALGSDMRVIPAQVNPAPVPPTSGPDIAAATPIRRIPAIVGTDKRNILALDPATYAATITVTPRIATGAGVQALFASTTASLVRDTYAAEAGIHVGDPLSVTYTDPAGKPNTVTYNVAGLFQAVGPSSPGAEVITSIAAVPIPLPQPDLYLVKTAAGHTVAEVAARITKASGTNGLWTVVTTDDALLREQSTLASLDLKVLARLELAGATLIAALGVGVLGAFVVLERRREVAILQAQGATTRQLLAGPAFEGALTVATSIIVGLPIGIGVTALSGRILTLLFRLPAPLARVPYPTLARLSGLVILTSAVALVASLYGVARSRPSAVLREA